MITYPFVSIIIPAKNEESNIGDCLDSVFNLNYPVQKLEILLIDNGSIDNTIKIARKRGVQIYNCPELTIAGLRNYGANIARGEFLAFLDGDCVTHYDWLIIGISYLLNDKMTAAIGFKQEEPLDLSWIEKTWYHLSSRGEGKYQGVQKVDWLSSFNLIISKEKFLEVGGFNEKLRTCEDSDLGQKLSKKYELIFSDEISIRHLGGVRSVVEFFMKEFWRGKDNLKSFILSSNKKKEFASVFLPLFYFICVSCFVFYVILYLLKSNNELWLYVLLIISIIIPIFLTVKKLRKIESKLFFQGIYLFTIYLLARGTALVCNLFRKDTV